MPSAKALAGRAGKNALKSLPYQRNQGFTSLRSLAIVSGLALVTNPLPRAALLGWMA